MPTENSNTPQGPAEEETPQGTSKRFPWSKEKVQDKPTRADKKAWKALMEQVSS